MVAKPLYVLGTFEPFGLTVEGLPSNNSSAAGDNAVGIDVQHFEERQSSGFLDRSWRYSLFDPAITRERGNSLEQSVVSGSCRDHDEELFIHGNTIIWSAGHQVRKRFTAPTTVMQALWCRFDSVVEPQLCVLHLDSLTTYSPSGEMNSVPLLYAMSSIWSLPCGLLLQRAFHGSVFVNSAPTLPTNDSMSANSQLQSCPVALHFTLQHPLEEPQALLFEEVGKVHSMLDVEEQIIWTSNTVPYVVSYHNARKQHSVWQIKTVQVKDELEFHPSGATFSFMENVSCIYLLRVWLDKGIHPVAHKVFLATDDDGMPILCIILKDLQRLLALRLQSHELSDEGPMCLEMEVSWTVTAVDSVPTVATRPGLRQAGERCFDLVVLAPDGNLYLHAGQHRLCQIYVPLLDDNYSNPYFGCRLSGLMQSEHLQKDVESQLQIVGLCDSVNGRFNAITSSGTLYRCAVCLPPASALTISCINALTEALSYKFYHFFLLSFWEYEFSLTEMSGISNFNGGGKPDLEWAAFSGLLMKWCERNHGILVEKRLESSSDWEILLSSTMHMQNLRASRYTNLPLPAAPECLISLLQPQSSKDAADECTASLSMLIEILDALHAVYEDCKLDALRWGDLQLLSLLLCNVAASLGQWNYLDYYARDFPCSVPFLENLPFQNPAVELKSPPNLFEWLENCTRGKGVVQIGNLLPKLLLKEWAFSVDWSRKVAAFYELLCGNEVTGTLLPSGLHVRIAGGSSQSPEQRMVLSMVAEGFGLPELDRLPAGVSLPLRHALNSCREAPPGDWPSAAFVLVGREDLALNIVNISTQRCSGKAVSANMIIMAAPYTLHLRPVPVRSSGDSHETIDIEAGSTDEMLNDGMGNIFNATTELRFGRDLRLNEVRRLLCSSKPVAVLMANPPDATDPDIVAQQQAQLWQLAQRTTSLPFGRAAFTLSTSQTILTETLPIPKLILAGRLPSQHDATVNLDATAGNIADLTSWPEFHNGVAAGLRLSPCQTKITRTWIVYNKPDEPSYAHAGLLMSLGLHQHLRVLAATDVYRYLSQEHEATTVGILLGMAAAYHGSMDPAISKMLYLHIPARHPPSFPELELPTLMQSAALMAVGMLYQGSAHRLTTEILLSEIGRKPGGDNVLEREGYALAAGLALGLVTLGRGKDAWGLADLMIEGRLQHYMSGGMEPSDERHRSGGVSNAASGASRNLEDLYRNNNGQVMEGSVVNVDVTAPGATLALALMFLKTNNEEVAARLAIPVTHFALEYVRPDFILLRIVAQSLIMWDSVLASEEWVQAQIPSIVKEAVCALKDGTVTLETLPADADMEALIQAHVNILAGACLSIGLRYAGTFNADAQRLLYHLAVYFLKEKRAAATVIGTVGPNGQCTYVDRGTLETCLNVAVLSLSVVMAGSGHLETFRLFRYLHRRKDSDGAISYGNHMAISMALGFLFLGGGTLTFANSNNAIAALLISLYPRFPTAPNDHRCHLQAFRHLYVLATEARCLQTVDVDTQLPVYVPLEITLMETHSHRETTFSFVTPCLLPECSLIKSMRVCGPRYWPQETDLSWWKTEEECDPFNSGVLYVKRRVGARSYVDDPIGCQSLLSRTRQRVTEQRKEVLADEMQTGGSKVDQLVSIFSADPSMLAFAQLCCNPSYYAGQVSDFEEFCSQALLECVSTDRPALLQVYLSLYTAVETIIDHASNRGGNFNSICNGLLSLCSLKVALAYVEEKDATKTQLHGGPLAQPTFLAALAKRIEDVFNENHFSFYLEITTSQSCGLVNYINRGQIASSMNMPPKCMRNAYLFACYLHWYNIPHPSSLHRALKQLCYYLPGVFSTNTSPSNSLPLLALLLPSTPTNALIQVNQCLPFLDITA